MANWTQQDFHVVGCKTDIDRFIRTGFRRHGPQQADDLLDFRKLCPLKRGEPKDTYSPDLGVVLGHFRTRTQALFSMITRWDYAPEFHARLSRHWPDLAFACSVNGEMEDFGGGIVSLNGEMHNLVRDYDGDYVRRTHARDIKRVLRQWSALLEDGRDFCLVPDQAWKHRSMPFDAGRLHDIRRSRGDLDESDRGQPARGHRWQLSGCDRSPAWPGLAGGEREVARTLGRRWGAAGLCDVGGR